jgi:heme-degrading monooxygenase HmoA
MFARVGIFQGPQEQLEDALRRGRQQTLPALQRIPGFAGLYVLADHQTGKSVAMSLWETEAAMQASEDIARKARGSKGRTEIELDRYEVVISPGSGLTSTAAIGATVQ